MIRAGGKIRTVQWPNETQMNGRFHRRKRREAIEENILARNVKKKSAILLTELDSARLL